MDGQLRLSATQKLSSRPLNWYLLCSPNGIRTRVATLRGWCPRPLDDGAERWSHAARGARRCSGGRTRTLNNWTRTSRVADYTTPEWVDVQISRASPSAIYAPDLAGPGRLERSFVPVEQCRAPGGTRHVEVQMVRWFTAGIGVFVLGFATLTALPAPVAG